MMSDCPLRTLPEYERALKEIEPYFENPPELGTEAADRFDRLAALIREYEDANFPIPADSRTERDAIISRFEQGLMIASDKKYILALLRSPVGVAASLEVMEQYEFPYQRTFDAVAAAIENAGGERAVTFSISVPKFQRAFNEHRDAKASPLRSLSPPEISRQYAAELGHQIDELEAENALPEAAIVCAELYQVIGYLAGELGVLDHPDVQRALDNAGARKLVHGTLLPWPKEPLQPA